MACRSEPPGVVRAKGGDDGGWFDPHARNGGSGSVASLQNGLEVFGVVAAEAAALLAGPPGVGQVGLQNPGVRLPDRPVVGQVLRDSEGQLGRRGVAERLPVGGVVVEPDRCAVPPTVERGGQSVGTSLAEQ